MVILLFMLFAAVGSFLLASKKERRSGEFTGVFIVVAIALIIFVVDVIRNI